MRRKKYPLAILAPLLLIASISFAQEPEQKPLDAPKERSLKTIEFLSGFGWSDLKSNNSYDIFPFLVDLGFDLKPLTKKIGFNPPGILQFELEPFANFVSYPDAGAEIGNSFLLKVGILPETAKIQPYAKLGIGMLYTSEHTREQATQFNFISSFGCGAHYFFRKNTAFTLEGRFRHLSNAGIKHPNNGINTYFVLAGIAYQF